jgi:formylglycine-generating enzyme required for sulfatase activity
LPSEAEWEYAARGGKHAQRTQYYFSDTLEELSNHAWFGEIGRPHAHAVDEINPRTGKENLNLLGLTNMSGNVWEWCADWFDASYYQNSPMSNPKGPSQGTSRVLRGGAWDDLPHFLRCARRLRRDPSFCNIDVGFRILQEVR